MRTTNRTLLALFLAMAMMLSLASTAFAATAAENGLSDIGEQPDLTSIDPVAGDELQAPPEPSTDTTLPEPAAGTVPPLPEPAAETVPPLPESAAGTVPQPPLPQPNAGTIPPLPQPNAGAAPVCPPKDSGYRLYVGGKLIPVNPFYQGSTLMLPLRVLAEKTGYTYEYRKGTVTMYGGGKTFSIKIGQNKYPVGGKTRAYACAPVLVDNYTYVPWLYLEQGLGMKVTLTPEGRVDVKLPSLSKVLYVNGKRANARAPYYSGKTLMVPLRAVAEALGCSYYYDNKARFSAFTKNGIETRVYWGKKIAVQGAANIDLDKAATLKGNSLFVPKSFIERMFNAKVTAEKNGRINVKTK